MTTTPEGLSVPDRSFDGYIFDNDGTLALSMRLHFEAWIFAYKNNGASFTLTREYAQSLAGVCMLETVRRVNADFGDSCVGDGLWCTVRSVEIVVFVDGDLESIVGDLMWYRDEVLSTMGFKPTSPE